MQNTLPMRISQGIALFIVGLSLIFMLLWGIDAYIIRPTFKNLQNQQAIEDADRVKSAIENSITDLGRLANDWAYWDDTYLFAQDHNRGYITSNYPDPAILSNNSNLDLFILFDLNGHILIQGNYHPDLKRHVELNIISNRAASLKSVLAPVFKNEENIDKLLPTEHGMLLITARPIRDSQEHGPSRGVLVMGRFLTQKALATIAKHAQVEFDLFVHDDERLTIEEQALFSSLVSRSSISPQVFQQGYLYQVYADIEHKPAILLRSKTRGVIHAVGQQTSNFLSVALLLISSCLLIALVFYRDRIKISEESLRDSDERYRTVFDNKHTVMLVVDPNSGHIVEANRAASDYYGWSVEKLKSMNIYDLNTLPTEEVIAEMILARSENRNVFTFQHRKADGTTSDVEVYSGPISIRGKVLLYSIVHDITARKQAVEALHESNECLQNVMNSINALVYIADMQTHELLFMNEYGKMIFGIDIVGQKCWKVLQNLKDPCAFCTNSKLLTANNMPGGVYRWEFQNMVNNRWYDITDRAIRWSDGQMVRMEIATDITERKKVEEERIDLERQLHQAQKVESLGRMAGAVAHHYNNLLGAVMGNLELAMLDLPAAASVSNHLVSAMNAAGRAAEIGKLMLAYVGQTIVQRKPLELSEICRKYLPELQTCIPNDIILTSSFPATGPIVTANPDQIRQILSNLVTNSWESIHEAQGTISVTIRTVAGSEISATSRFPANYQPDDTEYAVLEVDDSGSGISKKDIENIFDPFFSTRFIGRGLGLPVALGAVKAHNGCITVESGSGKGSIFRVFLPLSTDPLPIPESDSQKIHPNFLTGSVLIVEDEPIVRKMAENVLSKIGMTTVTAKDGIEAIEVFQLHKDEIRCVLCDLSMPRMDGWETITELRRIAPGIPVILTSAYDQAQAMAGDHRELPQIFLLKPYGVATLKDALERAMK